MLAIVVIADLIDRWRIEPPRALEPPQDQGDELLGDFEILAGS